MRAMEARGLCAPNRPAGGAEPALHAIDRTAATYAAHAPWAEKAATAAAADAAADAAAEAAAARAAARARDAEAAAAPEASAFAAGADEL
jgi:hypothetical protein